jgi:hypothetical protein
MIRPDQTKNFQAAVAPEFGREVSQIPADLVMHDEVVEFD